MSGQYYDGKHGHNGQKPAETKRGSKEETMIADCKESGMSHADTMVFLNKHRVDKNMPLLGVNAVKGAIKRMKKRLAPITKKIQGSNDPENDWFQARSRFTAQMLVRMGFDPDLTGFMVDGNLPECFQKKIETNTYPCHYVVGRDS